VYLYDRAAGTAQRLNIVTHGRSRAFANPTATLLRDPAGRQAVMVTLFVPMEGAAPGEAGSLLYHLPVDHQTRRGGQLSVLLLPCAGRLIPSLRLWRASARS
jgi:hypothetical protein